MVISGLPAARKRTPQLATLSRLSWNWRKRSSVKITERTYEEGTEAFHTRRKSSHLEAASCLAGVEASSFPRALGSARVYARNRCRSDPAASQGEVPGSQAANHLRQWPAVHRSRLQGVHSHLGHDARPTLPLLSTARLSA